jgi:hypothetical protein
VNEDVSEIAAQSILQNIWTRLPGSGDQFLLRRFFDFGWNCHSERRERS